MRDAAAVQHLNFDIYVSLFPKWLESAAAQMVVTVEANPGTEVPAVAREDVLVYQGRDRDEVKDRIPLQGDRARLELFILPDDASRANLAEQLQDLGKFVNSQPPTTAIG